MGEDDFDESQWEWSPIFGIVYGPIPVGLLSVGIAVVVYFLLY